MANGGAISAIIISIILLTILVAGITTYASSLSITTDSKTEALLTSLESEENTINTTMNNIKSGLEKLSTPNPGEFLIGSTQIASAIKDLVVAIPIAAYDTINGIGAYYNIPSWITNSILLAITVGIVFTVLSWLKGGGSL